MAEQPEKKNMTAITTVISSMIVGLIIIAFAVFDKIKKMGENVSNINYDFPFSSGELLDALFFISIGLMLILGFYTIFIILQLEAKQSQNK